MSMKSILCRRILYDNDMSLLPRACGATLYKDIAEMWMGRCKPSKYMVPSHVHGTRNAQPYSAPLWTRHRIEPSNSVLQARRLRVLIARAYLILPRIPSTAACNGWPISSEIASS